MPDPSAASDLATLLGHAHFVRDGLARRMAGPGDHVRWDLSLVPRPGVRVTFRLRFPPGEGLPETVAPCT